MAGKAPNNTDELIEQLAYLEQEALMEIIVNCCDDANVRKYVCDYLDGYVDTSEDEVLARVRYSLDDEVFADVSWTGLDREGFDLKTDDDGFAGDVIMTCIASDFYEDLKFLELREDAGTLAALVRSIASALEKTPCMLDAKHPGLRKAIVADLRTCADDGEPMRTFNEYIGGNVAEE